MQERAAASAVEAPALEEVAARRPVYLLFPDPRQGEALALDLRHYGLKARNFVNLAVLRNAARGTPPAAVIADGSILDRPDDIRHALSEASEAAAGQIPLLIVSEQDDLTTRLRAVRAGGSAFFRYPINRPALLHHLYRIPRLERLQQATVLLLDGGADADTLATGLEQSGIEVSRCQSGAELLAALRSQTPDTLLVNADQLDADAVELVQALRQIDAYQGLPVLLLTAADKRRLDAAAADAGVDAILGLPVQAKDLAAIVRTRTRRAADLQEAYRYLAKRDPLTGLYNADYLLDSLRHTLASRRGTGDHTALAVISLRGEGGTAPAEPVLVEAAERLRRLLPASAIAARLGGGELAITLYGMDAGGLEQLAGEVEQALGALRITIAGQAHVGHGRLGMTILHSDESSAAAAIARARQAADLGREEVQDAAEAERAEAALVEHWAARLRRALTESRFRLVYQPIASLSGHPTSYYEVFLRLLDEDGRDVLPREFMAAAQRGGLGPQLDRWVVERAAEVLAEQSAHSHRPVLFIKLFGESVADPALADRVADLLRAHRLPAEQLVFEISERSAATRLSEATRLAASLKQLGCRVALEHYADRPQGADLLRALQPDYLKLSAELTNDVVDSLEHQKRVQAVASQARAAGARTIAALVQDASNLSVLWRCGVEYIQGYFMQEPADVFAVDEPADV